MRYTYLIIGLIFFFSCSEKQQETEETATLEEQPEEVSISQQQFEAARMEFNQVKKHDFAQYIIATGKLEVPPQNKVKVSAYYGGYVKKIDLLKGQKVSAGEVLFTLENPEFIEVQQDYLETKSQLEYLRQDFQRQKVLVAEEIVSQKKYQKSKAEYDLVKNRLDALKRKIQMMKINPNSIRGNNIRSTIAITSPITGYVEEVYSIRGQFLSPQDVAVVVTNNDAMHLDLRVFEKDLPYIHKGMPVTFTLQENPNKIYNAEVHLISQSVDSDSRTAHIHCDVNLPPNERLSSGMFADARIKTDVQSKLALPKEAILERDNNKIIFIRDSNVNDSYIFKELLIETGIEDEEYVEIKTPLPENSMVLTKGGFQLMQ